jgi:phosphatidylserine/phosphatidylglycerophosphate/cardiolipin synthase-like enzyme
MKRLLPSLLFFLISSSIVTIPGPTPKPRVYFSGPCIQDKIIQLIQNERKSIRVAMYAFTNQAVARKLVEAHKRGVRVQCIIDSYQAKNINSVADYLRKNGIAVQVCSPEGFRSCMHLKMWNFESTQLYNTLAHRPCVITGSYNCTYNGTYHNFENIVVLFEQEIFKKSNEHFKKLKQDSQYISKK